MTTRHIPAVGGSKDGAFIDVSDHVIYIGMSWSIPDPIQVEVEINHLRGTSVLTAPPPRSSYEIYYLRKVGVNLIFVHEDYPKHLLEVEE